MFVAVEKDVFEGEARFRPVFVRVLPQVGLEFRSLGGPLLAADLRSKFKLLPHAAPDDDVVLIQPHGLRLAIRALPRERSRRPALHFFL
jgi:hypothetical protein